MGSVISAAHPHNLLRLPSTLRVPAWMVMVTAGFLVVALGSLTMEYVEGDEAGSLLYHALGRNEAVQPPLASYQRGMDILLGLLPADGDLLLTTARVIGIVSACACVILLLSLAFSQIGGTTPGERLLCAAVVVLAFPEFFYLGLLYTPLLAGLSAAVGAHLLIRRILPAPGTPPPARVTVRALSAGALLGMAGFIRWDMFLYAGVIALDLAIHRRSIQVPRNLSVRRLLIAAAASLAVTLALITAAYPSVPSAIGRMGHWARAAFLVPRAPDGVLELAGAHLSVFTPATVILSGLGVAAMATARRDLLMYMGALLIAVLLWPLWFSPKEMLLFAPVLILTVTTGVLRIARARVSIVIRRTALTATGLVLLLPWIFGIQGHHGDAAWGPGFEQRPLDRPVAAGRAARVLAGDGLAIPTREGHRPLWGHAHVLLGGGWKRFVSVRAEERRSALRFALGRGIPVVRIPQAGLLEEAELVRMGFTTADSFRRGAFPPEGYRIRRFTRGEVSIQLLEARPEVLAGLDAAFAGTGDGAAPAAAVITGWAVPMRAFYQRNRPRVTPLGKSTALFTVRPQPDSGGPS